MSYFLDDNNKIKYGPKQNINIIDALSNPKYELYLQQQWWFCLDTRLQSFCKRYKNHFIYGKYAGKSYDYIKEIDPEFYKKYEYKMNNI